MRSVQCIVNRVSDEILCCKEETTGTTAGVSDSLSRLKSHTLDHGFDERTRRKILTGAAFYVFCVFLQQAFVNLAFDVRGHGDPFLFVDHLNNAIQNSSIADLVNSSLENHAQQTALFTQLFKGLLILLFQFSPFQAVHVLPCVTDRNAGFFLVRRLGILI